MAMCKKELPFCWISTSNVENSTVLSRFSTFSTNVMLKTWKNTNCNTQKRRALCAIPFLREREGKKENCAFQEDTRKAFSFAARTPSGHTIPLRGTRLRVKKGNARAARAANEGVQGKTKKLPFTGVFKSLYIYQFPVKYSITVPAPLCFS